MGDTNERKARLAAALRANLRRRKATSDATPSPPRAVGRPTDPAVAPAGAQDPSAS